MRGAPRFEPTRARLRRALLACIGILYVFSIPWYREPGTTTDLWLGLPAWVTTALLCYLAVAVLNSLAWHLHEISDEDESGPT
ncbi:MAG: hypothetical protein MJE66_16845 [Proteobacteria bacterium]|nr:hypothetical protein [Pseudomonadota bacterium]